MFRPGHHYQFHIDTYDFCSIQNTNLAGQSHVDIAPPPDEVLEHPCEMGTAAVVIGEVLGQIVIGLANSMQHPTLGESKPKSIIEHLPQAWIRAVGAV